MTRRRTLAFLALGAVVCTCRLYAQADVPRTNPIDYGKAREQAQRSSQPGAPLVDADARGAAAAQTDYDIWSLQHRRATFEWQYTSTIIIFWAVIVLIAAGLMLSFMQFRAAAKHPSPTSIKIGKDGFEISSAVIGLLILFFSLGFFYLYLATVYPITEIGAVAAPPAATAAK